MIIGVVTVARSDFSIISPLLSLLDSEEDIELLLYVSGGHWCSAQGNTFEHVAAKNWGEIVAIPCIDENDIAPGAATRAAARALVGYATAFELKRPDLLIVTGDRFDMLPAAESATLFGIPLLHIHGGELTYGAFDEQIRHAITKLAHLHAVVHEDYARRVRQMGEEAWRVVVTGAMALDEIGQHRPCSRAELDQRFGFAAVDVADDAKGKEIILVTYHSETLSADKAITGLRNLLKVLSGRSENIVITAPNVDIGGKEIDEEIKKFASARENVVYCASLGVTGYYDVLSHAAAMLGNSSSGILESPSFRLPCLNIGDRQLGRITAENIVSCSNLEEDIRSALEVVLNPEFKESLSDLKSPFYRGGAAKAVLEMVREFIFDPRLGHKRFVDFCAS